LIGFETGAALALLVGAGLLVNSLGRLISQSAGMEERNLWVVSASLPLRYQPPRDIEYWTTALRLIRELPEVERATLAVNDRGPLDGFDIRLAGLRPDGGARKEDGFALSYREVGSGYFETLGIPIRAGRPILDSDITGNRRVAVLNQLAASTLWPGESPLGRSFGSGNRQLTVVGVVPDFKLARLDSDVTMQMYVPYTQGPASGETSAIMVRARSSGRAIGERVKALLLNLEQDLTAVNAATMAQVRWKQVATERFRTTVLAIVALTATFLALVGVFGLVAYTVTQRTREIGLRVALGSTYARVTRLLVRQALVPATIGGAAGVVAAFVFSRVLKTFLFEIEPTDPATFGISIGLFFVASATAALVAAFRAFRVMPATALRHE
jgi:putative ABC transport system permease protein